MENENFSHNVQTCITRILQLLYTDFVVFTHVPGIFADYEPRAFGTVF